MDRPGKNQIKKISTMRPQHWSKIARVVVALAILIVLSQAVSLVRRASRGESDFGVIYRTAILLNRGAGGELYDNRDHPSGWYRCIPPAGMVIFQPLALLKPRIAGIIWSLINLILLGGAIVALAKFFEKLDRQKRIYQSTFPWALVILLLFSTGSIQVGQFSILFVACWIFYLYATARGRSFWSGLSLAIPSAIKIYPGLMLAVPLTSGRRRGLLSISFFLVGIFIICAVIPVLVYGPRTWELTTSFFKNSVFGPEGKVSGFFDFASSGVSDQGLDAVFLRYLSHNAEFHSRFPNMPHLRLERQQVLLLTNVVRFAVLLVSAVVAFRWRRRLKNSPIFAVMMMVALWSAALYVILPGAKSRYAVYAFVGFLPLLGAAAFARVRGDRLTYIALVALIVLCFVLILQLIPDSMRSYGLGLIGSIALWIENIRLMKRSADVL